jgi:hypothetical protein
VGNVYYSEQGAQFGAEGEDGGAGVSTSAATRKFIDFLRNFRGDPSPGRPDGETLYRDRLDADPPPPSLTVALDDIIAHDAELAAALRKNPAEYIPLVRASMWLRVLRAADVHARCARWCDAGRVALRGWGWARRRARAGRVC